MCVVFPDGSAVDAGMEGGGVYTGTDVFQKLIDAEHRNLGNVLNDAGEGGVVGTFQYESASIGVLLHVAPGHLTDTVRHVLPVSLGVIADDEPGKGGVGGQAAYMDRDIFGGPAGLVEIGLAHALGVLG